MSVKDALTRVVDSTQHMFSKDEPEDGAPEGHGHTDALEILKRDHREVDALFKEVLEEEKGTMTGQRSKIDRILHLLEVHAKAEETLFYPVIHQKSKRDTEDRNGVLEAVEEHGSMKDLMRKIKRTTGRDETLRAKVQVLSEIVEHHVSEEESALFSEAKRLLGEKKLLAIGAEIEKFKARAARREAPKKGRSPRAKSSAPRAKAASKAARSAE
jgi:hemerythrin superfamily protein